MTKNTKSILIILFLLLTGCNKPNKENKEYMHIRNNAIQHVVDSLNSAKDTSLAAIAVDPDSNHIFDAIITRSMSGKRLEIAYDRNQDNFTDYSRDKIGDNIKEAFDDNNNGYFEQTVVISSSGYIQKYLDLDENGIVDEGFFYHDSILLKHLTYNNTTGLSDSEEIEFSKILSIQK